MPVFYLDGNPIEFEPGEKVLAAALRNGVKIPHYCYHPGLSVVATCRMCLVDVVDQGNGRPAPKLQTSCSTPAAENMKVITNHQKIAEARNLVMEFLLVNHPLDCPICDQSGECQLQDYSHEFGSGKSEMQYSKRVYGERDIGTFVTLERNRCIHCTRCERFTSEVTGTNEFGVFNRGHQLTVDTFTDQPMTNPFQGNMADICPVGCITEKEFRFKKRVWNLKKTSSLCMGCSTGCNITIESSKNQVYRFKPRENQDVNRWWMCDEGRMTYASLNDKQNRPSSPLVRVGHTSEALPWEDAWNHLLEQIKTLAPTADQVMALTDTQASNEELYLLKKLLKTGWNSEKIYYPQVESHEETTEYFIDSLITTDRSPNQRGAALLGLQGIQDSQQIQSKLQEGISLLVILGNPFPHDPELILQTSKIKLVIHISPFMNSWSDAAHFIFPGQTYAEQEGSYVNKKSRLQRTHSALRPLTGTKPQWSILHQWLTPLASSLPAVSVADVFNLMAQEHSEFQAISFQTISDLGQPLLEKISQEDRC